MIRVAICDDERLLLHGLEAALRGDPELDVVAAVTSGEAALDVEAPVDVWLMDVRLPGMTGVQVAAAMHAAGSPSKVLMMTAFDTGEVLNALEVGVGGFVYKDSNLVNIAAALKAVHAGYSVGNKVVADTLTRHLDRLAILDPERAERVAPNKVDRQLLEHVLRGGSVREMAADVRLTRSGVHKRLKKIFQRAGVANQRALTAWLHGSGESG